MEIEINEADQAGFNAQARDELKSRVAAFAEDLIREANRIESARNTTGDDPQVTSSMVRDASELVRRGLLRPRRGIATIIIRVLAAALSLIAGLMYDSTLLQESLYMGGFILVVAAAIVAVTLAAIRE